MENKEYRKSGILDTSGTEIVEGHVINADGYESNWKESYLHVVEFYKGSFGSDIYRDFEPLSTYKSITIVGHIDNPPFLVAEKEWFETDQDKTGWDCGDWQLISNGESVPDGYEIDEILDTDKFDHPTKATFKKVNHNNDFDEEAINKIDELLKNPFYEGDIANILESLNPFGFSAKLNKHQPDTPFLATWKKQYDELHIPLFRGKLCLTPQNYRQTSVDLIKLAEISMRSELQKKLTPIIEQLKSCNYQCEGGSLEMNVAFIELQNLLK